MRKGTTLTKTHRNRVTLLDHLKRHGPTTTKRVAGLLGLQGARAHKLLMDLRTERLIDRDDARPCRWRHLGASG